MVVGDPTVFDGLTIIELKSGKFASINFSKLVATERTGSILEGSTGTRDNLKPISFARMLVPIEFLAADLKSLA